MRRPEDAANGEQALAEIQERFRATFEQAAVGIVHTAPPPDRRFLIANRKFCDMVGYTLEELRGISRLQLTLPDDLDTDRELERQLIGGEIQTYTSPKRYIRKDGRIIWTNRTVSLVRDEDGRPKYFIRVVEDITERRQTEERFRAIFENAAVGITRVDVNGILADANQTFFDMLGYSREEILGKRIKEITHPDDYEEGARFRGQLVDGVMKSVVGEKRFLRRDGTVLWALRTMSSVCDEAGRLAYVISVVEDITQRKVAETERERLAAIVEGSDDAVISRDLDRRILTWNAAAERLFGYDAAEVIGRHVSFLIPEDMEAEAVQKRALVSGGQRIPSYDTVRLARDGRRIDVSTTQSPIRDASGRITGVSITFRDITARKAAEAALRVSEELFRAAFDQANVGIAISGLDMRYLQVNDACCQIVGYSREEMLRLTIKDILPPEDVDKTLAYRGKLIDGLIHSYHKEGRLIRKDGSPVWVSLAVSIVRDESGGPRYFVAVVQDISERARAEQALAQERTLLRAVVDAMPERIYVKDRDGRFLLQNAANLKVRGIRNHDEIVGKTMFDIFPRQMAEELQAEDRKVMESGVPLLNREGQTFFGRDGRGEAGVRWHVTSKVPLRDAQGNVFGVVGVNRDITERKLAEIALRESEEKFRQLANNIPEAFWITDAEQKRPIYISPAFEAMAGRALPQKLENPHFWLRIIHPDDRRRVHAMRRALPDAEYDIEYRVVRPDGTVRWVRDRAFPVRDGEGRLYRVAGIAEDITARREAEERLLHLAHYDGLTGLPNRVLFYDRLKQALAHARRTRTSLAVLFLDLDRFKKVNDTLGHGAGDNLLQQVSGRLTGCVRAGDTVGRLGGDEFAITLSDLADPEDARLVTQKILGTLATPFQLDGAEVYVTASIGITLYPNDSEDQDALLKNADTAMYRAKDSGRNGYQFYTPEMNARALERLKLENDLRRALERQEFVLYYQPKASLGGGEITGFEALLRWQHPEVGLVPPVEFVPMLEETGLIVPVGRWTLAAACRQIKAWEAANLRPLPVAINLSARQFMEKDLGITVKSVLEEYRVEARLIEFEITESSIMVNTEEAERTLAYMNDLGVSLAIDDFGTGYSSLSYLRRFPLDSLKIDRSFIRDITTNSDDATITRAIIGMAHNLNLKVIAEGVETEAQIAFLAANGCDDVQGYYFARPLPASECEQLLREERRLGRPAASAGSEAPTVLLVDDDEDATFLLKRQLERDGYFILTARDAQEGFHLLGKHRVDVVVSDQRMPGMSGVEFLQRVKLLYPATVRMMLAGHDDFKVVTEAINKSGVARYLPKSLEPQEIRACIRQTLLLHGRPSVGARNDPRAERGIG